MQTDIKRRKNLLFFEMKLDRLKFYKPTNFENKYIIKIFKDFNLIIKTNCNKSILLSSKLEKKNNNKNTRIKNEVI